MCVLGIVMSLTQIFAEAGLFESTERRCDVGFVVGVDKDGSSFKTVSNVHRFTDVLSKHTCEILIISKTIKHPNGLFPPSECEIEEAPMGVCAY